MSSEVSRARRDRGQERGIIMSFLSFEIVLTTGSHESWRFVGSFKCYASAGGDREVLSESERQIPNTVCNFLHRDNASTDLPVGLGKILGKVFHCAHFHLCGYPGT